MIVRFVGYVFVAAGLILAFSVLYRNSLRSEVPLIYTPSQLLAATWLNYKAEYVQQGTFRTIDTGRGDITTSEGQSYTLLRAVWMDDKPTFDGARQWTKDNLQRSGDHLFAWEWGRLPGGGYGVLTSQNGQNSASDADTDIALALTFAYARWQDPAYLDDARAIMTDIWNNEVVEIGGTPYLTADNLEKNSQASYVVVDPSYFQPAAYRIFAKVDEAHPWQALAQSSYHVLEASMRSPLGGSGSAGLPPDWIAVDKTTGAVSALPGADSNFGFDAMRVPFELALDARWFNDPKDTQLLTEMSFLSNEWHAEGALPEVVTHQGDTVMPGEAPAIYGGVIGYFLFADPKDAAAVYDRKLLFLYNPGANAWKVPLSYYDDNWAWFGIALYNDLLPNLTSALPQGAYNE